MKVLIAEDDNASRTMLTSLLRKWDYETVPVADGRAAWEVLQQPDTPKLLVLDWMMPGMDGLEVCHKLRGINTYDPPYVILLTARGEKADIVRGLEAGANDCISKPYNINELRARIGVGRKMVELQSQLNEAREALTHQALRDPLTGILNRRAILETLEKEIYRANRENQPLSIGMCDIDYFKRVNDTYGHLVGDELLRGFVGRIQNSLRSYDHIGRYGGEEFLLIAPGSSGSMEEGLYERLRRSVAATDFHCNDVDITITVSIGVAGNSDHSTVDGMLAEADAALFEAKRAGRNRVVSTRK